ncbi:MAG: hypothetical protein ACK5FU_07345 [Bacteroidota bacterium]
MKPVKSHHTMRLTALWALIESGLGGIMHAFKIPFTGFFLGGFAIVIITLIACYSQNRWKEISRATILVILIKAAVSPQSPPMAYLAVGFQGLAGALIFGAIGHNKSAAMLFGCIALFESAIQKFLVMTLIFGNSIWEALDLFFKGITKDLHLSNDFSFSFWLIAGYTFVYSIWGLVLGNWASKIPDHISKEAHQILADYKNMITIADKAPATSNFKKKGKWIATFFMLLFIISTFIILGSAHKALYAITRTIAALLLIFFIINPLVKWLLQLWIIRQKNKHAAGVSSLMDLLPELKNLVRPAFRLARAKHTGIYMYKQFVFTLLVLTLFANNE